MIQMEHKMNIDGKWLELKELESYIIILQRAIQNERDEIEFVDISNFLDMVLEKINHIMRLEN